jgi:hypothetical protein
MRKRMSHVCFPPLAGGLRGVKSKLSEVLINKNLILFISVLYFCLESYAVEFTSEAGGVKLGFDSQRQALALL